MTNILETMTDPQLKRWEKIRSRVRTNYIVKRALLGAIIPSLILWACIHWTSFSNLVLVLMILSLPVDYALARISWAFQEMRYENRIQANAIAAGK